MLGTKPGYYQQLQKQWERDNEKKSEREDV